MPDDIESTLIASLAIYPEKWDEVRSRISPADFNGPDHAEIYKAMDKLVGKFDLVILTDYLKGIFKKDIGSYLTSIIDLATDSNLDNYVNIIKERSKKRSLGTVSQIIKGFSESVQPVSESLKIIDNHITSLVDSGSQGFRESEVMGKDYIDRLARIKALGVETSGLTSGYRVLDSITDGFKPGELIVIGSRPSQGKTSCSLCFSNHIACELKKCVAFFSIESPETEIMNKLVSIKAEVQTKNLRTGRLSTDDESRIVYAVHELQRAKLFVNETPVIDSLNIRANIKKLISQGNRPDIIFLDYLQTVEVEKGNDTFANKIGRVTQSLKTLAKETKIPIVVLAQINRANGEEPPRLMDLKDSGAIEAIADMVILLHREEFYKGDDCPEESKGMIEIDVAKNRNGRTAMVKMQWIGQFTKIKELYA